MYKETNLQTEVLEFIKNSQEHDLSQDSFATISGIRGYQFGKQLFSTVIKFKDLMTFLEVFPDVQRGLSAFRVKRIKKYVLSGIEDQSAMRYFSSITVTARGHIFYDENTQKVAIDTRRSKMSINDGQHRFYGISEAIRELQGRINKTKDPNDKAYYQEVLTLLENMVIPIVIFNNISKEEEKQLFHDLNNLSKRPSRSATIQLAQTDLYSKMARQLSNENKYLSHYGVETDKMSIHPANSNTILLTTVYAIVKLVLKDELNKSKLVLEKDNFDYFKNKLDKELNKAFQVLPGDMGKEKNKYILDRSYAMQGVFKFIIEKKNEGYEEEHIYSAIEKADWTHNIEVWGPYGATEGKKSGNIVFGGSGYGSINSIRQYLSDLLPDKGGQMSIDDTFQEA